MSVQDFIRSQDWDSQKSENSPVEDLIAEALEQPLEEAPILFHPIPDMPEHEEYLRKIEAHLASLWERR